MWHLDELFVTIQGQRQYLWRAVDQDGGVIDILVQPLRDQRAAERFFREQYRVYVRRLFTLSAFQPGVPTIFPVSGAEMLLS